MRFCRSRKPPVRPPNANGHPDFETDHRKIISGALVKKLIAPSRLFSTLSEILVEETRSRGRRPIQGLGKKWGPIIMKYLQYSRSIASLTAASLAALLAGSPRTTAQEPPAAGKPAAPSNV